MSWMVPILMAELTHAWFSVLITCVLRMVYSFVPSEFYMGETKVAGTRIIRKLTPVKDNFSQEGSFGLQ